MDGVAWNSWKGGSEEYACEDRVGGWVFFNGEMRCERIVCGRCKGLRPRVLQLGLGFTVVAGTCNIISTDYVTELGLDDSSVHVPIQSPRR